jgi:PAS domain S-box-containing protein
MTSPSETTSLDPSIGVLHATLRRFASFAGAFAIGVAAAVLFGWGIGAAWLTEVSSHFVPMKPITAVAFILCGLALRWIAALATPGVRSHRVPRLRVMARISGIAVLLIGVTSAFEFLSSFQFHIDDVLFRHAVLASTSSSPFRMSWASAIAFVLFGGAIILMVLENIDAIRGAQILSLGVFFLSLLHLLGYLYGAQDLYRAFMQNPMAVHTAFLFFLLTLGLLSARPTAGIAGVFNGPGTAAHMARRILPAASVISIVIGGLRLIGEREGLYGTAFGLSLFTTGSIAMLFVLIGIAAHSHTESIRQLHVTSRDLVRTTQRAETIRKEADEKIRQQARLLNLAPAIARDMQGRIFLWTDGAQRLYGFSSEEAVGRVTHELLRTKFPRPLEEIERILLRDGMWEGELEHCAKDGRTLFVASQWLLENDAKGAPARVLVVNADLTELRRAQKSQVRSQKLESLGTLAGGVAHDFNNILAAINGNAKLALDDLAPNDPIRERVEEIEKAGSRATDLVRRILAFSRPQEVSRTRQALSPIVDEALKLVKATLPKSITIQTDYAPDLPMTAIDATQIHQIVVNLATNASHAIGEKPGTISIRLYKRVISADDRIASPALASGTYVCLSVSDDGCGMDPSTLERIFDPFFTTKAVGQGTGLGLSIVHGIVTSYGGTVSAYSHLGQGTSFLLYFPALESVEAVTMNAPPPVDATSPRVRNEHILFIDDEEALVSLGEITLGRLGYYVTGCTDPSEAIATFRAHPDRFAAVISDVSMPKVSGFEVAGQIRAIRPSVPILLASGYISQEDQDRATALNIHHLLQKPTSLSTLTRALDEALSTAPSPAPAS